MEATEEDESVGEVEETPAEDVDTVEEVENLEDEVKDSTDV